MTDTIKLTRVPTMRTNLGARIMQGHSIQNGKVFDNAGDVWGIWETHAEALAAVEAYRAAYEVAYAQVKAEGAKDVQKRICDALGLI